MTRSHSLRLQPRNQFELEFYGLEVRRNSTKVWLSLKVETEAEHLLLAWQQVVENDKIRNGNREALTALRKRARTTKISVPSPFESIMKDIGTFASKPSVREVCTTCGNHNSDERTWMMFP